MEHALTNLLLKKTMKNLLFMAQFASMTNFFALIMAVSSMFGQEQSSMDPHSKIYQGLELIKGPQPSNWFIPKASPQNYHHKWKKEIQVITEK